MIQFQTFAFVATKESMFTACSACTFLKNLLDKTPRDQTEIVVAIRKRLGPQGILCE